MLIDEGDKIRNSTKARVTEIEDIKVMEFGKDLIKFNEVLEKLQSTTQTEEQKTLAEGIKMTERILLNTLKKFQFENHGPAAEKSDKKAQPKIGWMYKMKSVSSPSVNL